MSHRRAPRPGDDSPTDHAKLKLARLESSIERALQQVFARGLSDPRVRGLITITGVRVLPDLTEAHVRLSVLPAEHEELTLHGIVSSAAHIRREVGDLVDTRTMPKLRFELDHSLKKQVGVLLAIDQAKRDLEHRVESGLASPEAPPEAAADPAQPATEPPREEDHP